MIERKFEKIEPHFKTEVYEPKFNKFFKKYSKKIGGTLAYFSLWSFLGLNLAGGIITNGLLSQGVTKQEIEFSNKNYHGNKDLPEVIKAIYDTVEFTSRPGRNIVYLISGGKND